MFLFKVLLSFSSSSYMYVQGKRKLCYLICTATAARFLNVLSQIQNKALMTLPTEDAEGIQQLSALQACYYSSTPGPAGPLSMLIALLPSLNDMWSYLNNKVLRHVDLEEHTQE